MLAMSSDHGSVMGPGADGSSGLAKPSLRSLPVALGALPSHATLPSGPPALGAFSPQRRTDLVPKRVTCASLRVQKGRFSSENSPFCASVARQKPCMVTTSVEVVRVDSLN